MNSNNPFAEELRRILPSYGSARSIAGRMGIAHTSVTKAIKGEYMPDVDFVDNLISPMPLEHRAAIAISYCLANRPSNAPMVKIGTSLETCDRLDLAIAALPSFAREHLADYVEAVLRDPQAGYAALEGLAGMVNIGKPSKSAGINESPGQAKPSPVPQPSVDYRAALKAGKKDKGEGK